MGEKNEKVAEERMYSQKEVEGIVANINNQARAQCEIYQKRCNFFQEQLSYRRLDYLFKVLEYSGHFNEAFIKNCIKEIEDSITIPEETENTEEDKEE